MSLLASVKDFLSLPMQQADLQERTILASAFDDPAPDLATQLALIRNGSVKPWRQASIGDALSVPAIFRAVSLIATTAGSLSLEAFRNGVKLDPADRPRVMVRPDPFRKPRAFFRDTAWNLATRGEAWWWVAKRDSDGGALSLLNVPPNEVTVEEDPRDLRFPIIKWRGKTMKNDDFRQLVFVQEPGSLRGIGPLQKCGAAVSVAVESQEWAANFYSDGGYPSLWIKTSIPLSGGDGEDDPDGFSEVQRFKNDWVSTPHNTPRVSDDTIEDIKEIGTNAHGAQMLPARDYQNGEAARMFGMPGSLLDYSTPGSSLTYQNLEGEFTKWVRAGLWPYYLEEMEQEMSDLLTRSTVARFNIDALTRPDAKTRFEIYTLGIQSGVLTAEMAQQMEGILPGDVENAPVPFSVPAAIPAALPVQIRSMDVRCDATTLKRRGGISRLETCNKLLSTDGTRPDRCPRCKTVYAA